VGHEVGLQTDSRHRSADEELPTLDKWAREQEATPWYRFSTAASAGSDPGELTEAVGDADAVKSTALGVKNLQRVAKMLMTATTTAKANPTTISPNSTGACSASGRSK
jgi:hypothetical protein